MATTKFLARDITIEIESGTTFMAIGGIESLTHSPSSETADTTDFDSGGRAEHFVAQRGDEWTLAGFALEDVDTGAQDPGQQAVEELARAVGPTASLGTFRLTSPGGNTLTFDASAEVTLPGGAHNDSAAWSAKLTVSGEIQYTGAES